MQVVADIIQYLDSIGLLDGQDIEHLRKLGFLAPDDADLLEPAEPQDLSEDAGSLDHDLIEEAAERAGRRPGPRRRQPAAAYGSAEAVSNTILAAWPAWEPELAGLTDLARLIGAPADGLQALRVLRSAAPHRIDEAVEAALVAEPSPFWAIWDAVTLRAYRDIVPAKGGGVAVACRVLLAASCVEELGRHAAMLRHEGFARLFLLIQVQRAVLAAFGRRFAARPDLFDACFYPNAFRY